MPAILFSIASSYGYVNFLLFSAVSVFFGTVVYLLMRRPSLRRVEFRMVTGGPASRRSAIIASSIVALPFLIYGYCDSWMHYYRLSSDGAALILDYRFPERTYLISDLSGLKVVTEAEVRKGIFYRIKLIDTARHEYTSQLMNRKQWEENLAALTSELKKQGNTDAARETNAN